MPGRLGWQSLQTPLALLKRPVRIEIRALAAISLLDLLVIPKAKVQDSELVIAEQVSAVLALVRSGITAVCPPY